MSSNEIERQWHSHICQKIKTKASGSFATSLYPERDGQRKKGERTTHRMDEHRHSGEINANSQHHRCSRRRRRLLNLETVSPFAKWCLTFLLFLFFFFYYFSFSLFYYFFLFFSICCWNLEISSVVACVHFFCAPKTIFFSLIPHKTRIAQIKYAIQPFHISKRTKQTSERNKDKIRQTHSQFCVCFFFCFSVITFPSPSDAAAVVFFSRFYHGFDECKWLLHGTKHATHLSILFYIYFYSNNLLSLALILFVRFTSFASIAHRVWAFLCDVNS